MVVCQNGSSVMKILAVLVFQSVTLVCAPARCPAVSWQSEQLARITGSVPAMSWLTGGDVPGRMCLEFPETRGFCSLRGSKSC